MKRPRKVLGPKAGSFPIEDHKVDEAPTFARSFQESSKTQ